MKCCGYLWWSQGSRSGCTSSHKWLYQRLHHLVLLSPILSLPNHTLAQTASQRQMLWQKENTFYLLGFTSDGGPKYLWSKVRERKREVKRENKNAYQCEGPAEHEQATYMLILWLLFDCPCDCHVTTCHFDYFAAFEKGMKEYYRRPLLYSPNRCEVRTKVNPPPTKSVTPPLMRPFPSAWRWRQRSTFVRYGW